MRVLWVRWRSMMIACVMMLLLLGVYYSRPAPKSCPKTSLDHEDLAPIASYCNPIDKGPETGQEGSIPSSKYHLEQVHVIIRHGDRYNLHHLPNHNVPALSCDMERFPEIQHHVPEVEGYVESMQANTKKIPAGTLFQNFPLYPNQGRCENGHLTPRGAAQHIRNGAFLKKIYVDKWGLISPGSGKEIQMISTVRLRTFQSGLALLYGLVPDLDMNNVGVTSVTDARMCADASITFPCHCYAIQRFINVIGGNFAETRPLFVGQKKLAAAFKDVAESLSVPLKSVPKASHVMDVAMVHVCHHLNLPGQGNHCIKPQSVRHVMEAINNNGFQQEDQAIYKQISRLRMLPLLQDILHTFEARERGQSDTRFVLHSGHDSTVAPLLTALNVSEGTWPPYAARVVIEMYSTIDTALPGPQRYFVRFLYNGQDITNKVIFCHGKTRPEWENMCPLDNYRKFISSSDGLADLNIDNYSAACAKAITL